MSKKAEPKTDRLKKRSDFLRVQGEARKWVSPTVIVQAGKGEGTGPRFGLTATKKLGNAVIRNRIKRRLRAAAKTALAGAMIPNDIVFIGRVETATCPFEVLLKDMRWCLRKLDVKLADKTA